MQPTFGGPVYIFRNSLYNVVVEPFKIHNSPSGVLIFNNTIVKNGVPMVVMTPNQMHNFIIRNNLFVGTKAGTAIDFCPRRRLRLRLRRVRRRAVPVFLRWNGQHYATFEQMKAKAPIEQHATRVEAGSVFASGIQPPEDVNKQYPAGVDLRLSANSEAVDAGRRSPTSPPAVPARAGPGSL